MFDLGQTVVYRGVTAKVIAKTFDSENLYDLQDTFGQITTYVPESAIRASDGEDTPLP